MHYLLGCECTLSEWHSQEMNKGLTRGYMHFPPFHHTQMAKDGKYTSMAIYNAYSK